MKFRNTLDQRKSYTCTRLVFHSLIERQENLSLLFRAYSASVVIYGYIEFIFILRGDVTRKANQIIRILARIGQQVAER